MRVTATALPEVLVIEPTIHRDARGYLLEAFSVPAFVEAGLVTAFVQDNQSQSVCGVIRALHYQLRAPQGKLVTAVSGEIFDVAVDIRVGSPRFGQWAGSTLRSDSPRYLWIPPGFAHGFAVLSESATVTYKCTARFDRTDSHGIRWNDPAIGIEWPVEHPLLSAADLEHPLLRDAIALLPAYTP